MTQVPLSSDRKGVPLTLEDAPFDIATQLHESDWNTEVLYHDGANWFLIHQDPQKLPAARACRDDFDRVEQFLDRQRPSVRDLPDRAIDEIVMWAADGSLPPGVSSGDQDAITALPMDEKRSIVWTMRWHGGERAVREPLEWLKTQLTSELNVLCAFESSPRTVEQVGQMLADIHHGAPDSLTTGQYL
jgi:hypothetical protein